METPTQIEAHEADAQRRAERLVGPFGFSAESDDSGGYMIVWSDEYRRITYGRAKAFNGKFAFAQKETVRIGAKNLRVIAGLLDQMA